MFWESNSIEYLTRLLFWARWFLGIVGVLVAVGALVNLKITDRITKLQEQENIEAQNRLKDAEEATRVALEEAAGARKKADEVHQRQKHRSLSHDQRGKLLFELKALSGLSEVDIRYTSGDKESEAFASEISSVFQEANMTSQHSWWMGSPLQEGLMILSRSELSDKVASQIDRAFRVANIPAKYARGALIPDKDVVIIIGPKP